jgi:hypothetical protein
VYVDHKQSFYEVLASAPPCPGAPVPSLFDLNASLNRPKSDVPAPFLASLTLAILELHERAYRSHIVPCVRPARNCSRYSASASLFVAMARDLRRA